MTEGVPVRAKARLRDSFRDQARLAALAAAEEVFAEEGLAEAKVERIAQRAGVSVGTLYNLFGDREGMLSALILARQTELVNLIEGAISGPDAGNYCFSKRLERFVSAIFEHVGQHWRFFRLIAQAEHACGAQAKQGPARMSQELMLRLRRMCQELVQSGIDEGAVRNGPVHVYAAMLKGTLREVIFMDAADGQDGGPPKERVEQCVQLFLQGAGKR